MQEPEFGTPLYDYWLAHQNANPSPVGAHCNCACSCMISISVQMGTDKCDRCRRGIHMPVTSSAHL